MTILSKESIYAANCDCAAALIVFFQDVYALPLKVIVLTGPVIGTVAGYIASFSFYCSYSSCICITDKQIRIPLLTN